MLRMRKMFSCLVFAIVIAFSMNGVAMSANSAGQHAHCADAAGGDIEKIDSTPMHEHGGIEAQHVTPAHDHDTCMLHACPALSTDVMKLGELTDIYLTTLSWPEQRLLVRELSDGLKRPPKS